MCASYPSHVASSRVVRVDRWIEHVCLLLISRIARGQGGSKEIFFFFGNGNRGVGWMECRLGWVCDIDVGSS